MKCLLVLLTVIGMMALTACAEAAEVTSSEAATEGNDTSAAAGQTGTMVIRNMGNLTSWNPALTSDGASIQARRLLWPAMVC